MNETNFFNKNYETYYIFNKSTLLGEFLWDLNNPYIPSLTLTKDYNLPDFISKDLVGWLDKRTAPKHREHIETLLEKLNINNLKSLIDVSKGLSLIDTLWITNDPTLDWNKINLYDNPFDETISKIAFTGGLFGEVFSTTSPEFGTDGMLAKCWIRDFQPDGIYLIKTGTEGYSNAGMEPYSEVLATQVLNKLGYSHVPYTLVNYHKRVSSKCPLMTSKDVSLLTIPTYSGIISFYNILTYLEEKNLAEDFYKMLIFDYLSNNNDRHLGNFGLLVNSTTFEIISLAPLYDNGCSFMPYWTLDQDLNKYCKKHPPALYNSYEALAKYSKEKLLNNHNVNNLINFKFDKSQLGDFPTDRLQIIENFLQERVNTFLSW